MAETLAEVGGYTVVVFFESLILWIPLTHFICQILPYNVHEYVLQCQLIGVLILYSTRKFILILSLLVGFHLHDSDALVGSFDLDALDVTLGLGWLHLAVGFGFPVLLR